VTGAVSVWTDMIGLHGITLPEGLLARLGPLTGLAHAIGVRPDASSGAILTEATLRITILMAIVLCLPNTLQILAPYEPAIGFKPAKQELWLVRRLRWTGSAPWAVGIATVAAAGILSLGQLSEFLYWQF
jgi:alginate O-acetyltransferase complex protein AlgI